MTDAIAVLGILALVTSGELARTVSAATVIGLCGALAVPDRWQLKPAMRRFATLAPLILLFIQLTRLMTGASVLQVAVEFAAGLQIIRLATRRGAAHDQQVVVLALLHLIAGTVIGGGLGYACCFIGFLIVAPGALVLSHLRREVEGNYRQGARDRTGLPVDVPRILRSRRVVDRAFLVSTCLLSVPIFWFTAGLFVLFPRVGLSFLLLNHPHGGRMVGFSEHVDLGQVGTLRSDPTIALRIEIPDLPTPRPQRLAMHLRGAAFDTYDGRSWSHAGPLRDGVREVGLNWSRRATDPRRDRVWHVDLEPIDPPVIFAPLHTVEMQVRPRGESPGGSHLEVSTDAEGAYRYSGADERGLRYDLYVGTELEPEELLSHADLERYTAFPRTVSDRVRHLAHEVAPENGTAIEKARAIESFLRRSFAYDLSSPAGHSADPIDDFLFASKRGHCEFYSTAMVLLLRELKVPARNVTGFIGGSYNRFGQYYAVRQGDAHSWVEVYLPDRGWQTFDPTPPSDAAPRSELSGTLAFFRDIVEASAQRWDRYVIGYDLRQQMRLFDSVSKYGSSRLSFSLARGKLVWVAGSSLVAAGAAYAVWRRRRARIKAAGPSVSGATRERQLATALYELLEQAMSSQGIGRGPAVPPLRHAEALHLQGHPLAPDVLELTMFYLDARFGGAGISDEDRRNFESVARKLRTFRPETRGSRLA